MRVQKDRDNTCHFRPECRACNGGRSFFLSVFTHNDVRIDLSPILKLEIHRIAPVAAGPRCQFVTCGEYIGLVIQKWRGEDKGPLPVTGVAVVLLELKNLEISNCTIPGGNIQYPTVMDLDLAVMNRWLRTISGVVPKPRYRN